MSLPRKKRVATSQLNHENWDEEEEKVEAGHFVAASKEAISERRIVSAKRRLTRGPLRTDGDGEPPKIFAGFAGFDALKKTTAAKTTLPLPPSPPKAGVDLFKAAAAAFVAEKGLPDRAPFQSPTTEFPPQPQPTPLHKASNGSGSAPRIASTSALSFSAKPFERELRNLNVQFVKQLTGWVTENSYVDLSPAFADYSRHLADIERRHGPSGGTTNSTSATISSQAKDKDKAAPKPSSSPLKGFSFTRAADTETKKQDPPAQDFFSEAASKRSESSRDSKPTNVDPKEPTPADPRASSPFFEAFAFASSKETTPTDPKTTDPVKGFSFEMGKSGETTKTASSGFTFSFGGDKGEKEKKALPGFAFGAPVKEATAKDDKTPDATPLSGFTFGGAKTGDSAAKTLSFPAPSGGGLIFPAGTGIAGSGGGFSFGDKTSKAGGAEKAEEEETDYVPPVSEDKAADEPDAYFTCRAKLFHQKDGKYAQGAVGNLFLKEMTPGKVQILIRADTSLGNILLNVALNKDSPLSATKNNVNLFSVPSPLPPGPPNESEDDKEKRSKVPVPMLIRVKKEEDAEQLITQIKSKF